MDKKVGDIYQAISAIMSEIGAIGKTQVNQKQGFKFRGIDDVYNAVQPLMAKYGVFSVPEVVDTQRDKIQTTSGTHMTVTVMRIKYRFFAKDGSSIETVVTGEAADAGDKGATKAQAIAHKYALLQIFAIPTEEKMDPDYDAHELVPNEPPKQTPTEPKKKLTGAMTEAQFNKIAAVSTNVWGKKQAWLETKKIMTEKLKKEKLDELSKQEASDLIGMLEGIEKELGKSAELI